MPRPKTKPLYLLKLRHEAGIFPHSDLVEVLQGFHDYCQHLGEKIARLGDQITQYCAHEYLEVFKIEDFLPSAHDPDRGLKLEYLQAIQNFRSQFGDRLPRFFYATWAFMGTRPDPTQTARIPAVAHLLPYSMKWYHADAVLHSLPLLTKPYLHLLSLIHQETGRIPVHDCGCDHAIPEPIPGQTLRAFMNPAEGPAWDHAPESWLRHAMGQLLLLRLGFPQHIGLSAAGATSMAREQLTSPHTPVLRKF